MILQFFRRKPKPAPATAQVPNTEAPKLPWGGPVEPWPDPPSREYYAPKNSAKRGQDLPNGEVILKALEQELMRPEPPPIDPMEWLRSFPLEERLYRRRKLKAEIGMLRFVRAPAPAPEIEWRRAA